MENKFLLTIIISLLCSYSFSRNLKYISEISSTVPSLVVQSGMGYSSDSQTPSSTVCFNTQSVTKGGQESILRFDQSVNFDSLLRTFEFSASAKVGIGAFSANAEASYFHSIKDEAYSLSVNYFQKVSQQVSMTYTYDPNNILTETGKNIYNNGQNQFFRLFCGDYLIRSYKEGARLIFSFNVKFKSREEKETFKASAGASFGGFVSASTSIS